MYKNILKFVHSQIQNSSPRCHCAELETLFTGTFRDLLYFFEVSIF